LPRSGSAEKTSTWLNRIAGSRSTQACSDIGP
jgi:hypothetical protein